LHVDFEYVLAGIAILLILLATEINMSTVMSQQITRMEQERGYTLAEKILDTILLSPGDPEDWGNYPSDPSSFGLAAQDSLKAYVLDANKVIRLSGNSTYYLSPGKVRYLLGLSRGYQFSLNIMPIFNIGIVSDGDGNFTLNVTNYKGLPAPNVNVTGYYIPESWAPGVEYTRQSGVTGFDGGCALRFNPETDHALVVCASQLGVKATETDPKGLRFRVEGDSVVKGDTPLVPAISYSTGSPFGMKRESVSRYAEIEGLTYYVEFGLWS